MFWSPALYSGTYFQTSVATNSLFQASLRKQGEFVLVPQLRLLSWKASQKKATHRTVCSTFFKQNRKSCRVWGVFLYVWSAKLGSLELKTSGFFGPTCSSQAFSGWPYKLKMTGSVLLFIVNLFWWLVFFLRKNTSQLWKYRSDKRRGCDQ